MHFFSFQTAAVINAEAEIDAIKKQLLTASDKNVKNLTCTFCPKVLTKTSLKRHLMTHMDIPYKCSSCSVYFHTKSQFEKHMRDRHVNKSFSCDQCGARYHKQTALKEHQLIKHSNQHLAFSCETCGKQFNRLSHYEDHLNVHKKVNPWVCSNCKRAYKSRWSCLRHVSECGISNGNHCEQCGQVCKTKQSLHEHIKRHHKNITYLCTCGCNFKTRCDRMRHRKACQTYKHEMSALDDQLCSKNETLDPVTGIVTTDRSYSKTLEERPELMNTSYIPMLPVSGFVIQNKPELADNQHDIKVTDTNDINHVPLNTVVAGDLTVYLETTADNNMGGMKSPTHTELVVVSQDGTNNMKKVLEPGQILEVEMVNEQATV